MQNDNFNFEAQETFKATQTCLFEKSEKRMPRNNNSPDNIIIICSKINKGQYRAIRNLELIQSNT